MPTRRHPVLIWAELSGMTTAALVGDSENAAAYAATAEEALGQLKELLDWRLDHEPWNVDLDFTDPALCEVKVEVRPQYTEGKRLLPCPETVWLRVPCVTGRQENGLFVAAVPHLGVRFDFQDASTLKSLVAHFVKEVLHGLTPLQLAGRLPPRSCRLDEIVLREEEGRKARRPPPHQRPELKTLFAVSDPLLHGGGRRRPISAAFGREKLAEQLATKLVREKVNILLMGETGVGKSTVLFDAAKRAVKEKPAVPPDDEDEDANHDLRTYRFWRGSAGRMIAGMRYLGEWEERCEEFIEQLSALEGVFCVENLLELVQVGGAGPGDSVGAFLLTFLERGELRIVAEATPSEIEACRRLLPGLLDLFQIVPVPVFSEDDALAVMGRLTAAYGTAARIVVEPGVPALVHRLFQRFQPYTVFPGPAARFLRGLCDHRAESKHLRQQDAMVAFTRLTGLPEFFLRDDLPLAWESVRDELLSKVIGQPEATAAAASIVTSIKTGLTDPARPFGVLLFTGPTGVGKTELVKALAGYCFGAKSAKDRLVRLDMSEYSGGGAAQRLLEATNGRQAPWVERVRQQPFCVVLFDEIEKAAPEVFDVLLSLLDEGRLTDRFGRVTQFRSTIVVLTSNLGANRSGPAGFAAAFDHAGEPEVAKFFRPEFFNRLNAVVTFRPLSRSDMEAITRKELAGLALREGFVTAALGLEYSEELVTLVARACYDPRFGARPLQRAVERMVATPLARWKIAHPEVRNVTLQIGLDAQGALLVSAKGRSE